MDIAALIAIIGVLVALTNVIVEVLKKLTWEKLPTNVLAVVVAVVLTMASGIAYWQIKGFTMVWYVVAAMFVVGLMVAYAAMFGFDKLKEAMKWKDVKTNE